jgi:phosphate-selective porin
MAMAVILPAAAPAAAQQTSTLNLGPNGSISFTPGLRVQPRYTYDNADGNNDFFIARVRFKGGGNAFGIATYFTELKLDNVGRFARTVNAQIENAWMNFALQPALAVRVGLYDAVFSRDALTSDSKLLFMDRSLIKDALTAVGLADNTVGLLAHSRPMGGRLEVSGGVFDNLAFDAGGTGANARQADGAMVQGRVGVHLLDRAPVGGYGDYQSSYLGSGRRLSIAVSAAYLSKAKQDTVEIDLDGWGADVFFNAGRFTAQAEYGRYDQDASTGDVVGDGWYAQAGYLVHPRIELAVRYQELDPTDTSTSDRLQWTAVGANFYIREHNLKVQTDCTFKREQGEQVSNDLFQVQLQLDF